MNSISFRFWDEIKMSMGFPIGWELSNPSREGEILGFPPNFSSILVEHLKNQGVMGLYRQQFQSFEMASNGESFLVATATASGKSLCFWLPILNILLNDPNNCALVLFPTKALAANQFKNLSAFLSNQPELVSCVKPFLFNGDVSSKNKTEARKRANILFTNPDSLHASILPQNGRWSRFLKNLKYIVCDEAHSYRGVFGSHVSLLFSRLRRISDKFESSPSWILASATLGNDLEHGQNLIGTSLKIIREDSAPRSASLWASLETEQVFTLGGKTAEIYQKLGELCHQFSALQKKVLVFTQSRLHCELFGKRLREITGSAAKKILVYRSGLSRLERENLDRQIHDNEFEIIVGTSALEMGLDIGVMDVVIILGFPPTVSSFRQQAGRTARGKNPGLVLYIPMYNPLDRFFAREAKLLKANFSENASCDPNNSFLLESHIKCAAMEFPLSFEDKKYFGPKFEDIVNRLLEKKELQEFKGKWYFPIDGSHEFSLRTFGEKNYDLMLRKQSSQIQIGQLEEFKALRHIFKGAIYLSGGKEYQVESFEPGDSEIILNESGTEYYTYPVLSSKLEEEVELSKKIHGSLEIGLSKVTLSTEINGLKKINFLSGKKISQWPVFRKLPLLETESVIFSLDNKAIEIPLKNRIPRILESLGELIKKAAVVGLMIEVSDLDVNILEDKNKKTKLIISDVYAGGLGISKNIFAGINIILEGAEKILNSCTCSLGCPFCIGKYEKESGGGSYKNICRDLLISKAS